MPSILTVDDSKAIRNIVTKNMQEMGFTCDEAEHGIEGLSKLEACAYDLIVLDVTMPELDGPGMLQKLRATGNRTPVLMLTSESKRSIVAEVMKLGIEDYILKPFKPEELREKVIKILKGPVAPAAASIPLPSPSEIPQAGGGKQFIDILVVDDMENVHKKLRGNLPNHISMKGSVSAQAAVQMCREGVYRVVLIDTDMPDVNSAVLMNQLKLLQPHAAFLALALRSANEVDREVREQGFEECMYKPFDKDGIDDFLLRYFDNQELIFTEDNLLRMGPYVGREDRVERYYQRSKALIGPVVDKMAAACFEDVVLDLTNAPLRIEHTPKLVLEVEKHAKRVGLKLRIVGTVEGGTMLKEFVDTGSIPFYASVNEARAAA